MDEGDVLHILVKDLVGTSPTISMVGDVSNAVPGQPTALNATEITADSFVANWRFNENSDGYYLDVATDSAFTSMVTGYDNLNVGNYNRYRVEGLIGNYTFYYRIRAYNNIGTSIDSITESAKTLRIPLSDWFLPSKDELSEIYIVLHLFGIGNFVNNGYWSSSEMTGSDGANNAWYQHFITGDQNGIAKNTSTHWGVRAVRSFVSVINYNLRDIGPAGGYIFWKSVNNYLEAAPSDQSASSVWSNIQGTAVGISAQNTSIGTGQVNTTAIINQVGHTDSAAKICNDLVV
jgi:hypothetical protein